MNNEIKEILNKIISYGFSAYIVGGYVRDYLLNKETKDIDIATSALPKDLKEIFADEEIKITAYGSIKLVKNGYSFDITTFRKDLEYKDNTLVSIEYIDNIEEDIQRRDFTINALYMDVNEKIYDKVNGINDINKKIIKVINDDYNQKFQEDSSRVIRALRFMITLDFSIDNGVLEYIHLNKKKLKFNKTILKEELSKMLTSENVVKYFEYLKNIQLLDILKIDFDKLIYVDDICGMYAQLTIEDELPFTKEEKDNIKDIQSIVRYGTIDYGILFKYDLYICSIAGSLLGIDKKRISELYSSMPIKNIKELKINGDMIQEILSIEPSKVIKDILDSLVFLVLNKQIENNEDVLKEYIVKNKRLWLDEL